MGETGLEMPETTDRTSLVVMVANQLGQHTKAIETLEATQRETNRHLKDLGTYLSQTVRRKDCERTRGEMKRELKRNGNGSGHSRMDARAIIALISVCLVFLFGVVGAVWFVSGEMSSLKTAVEQAAPVKVGSLPYGAEGG